jgi:hypothetical protein
MGGGTSKLDSKALHENLEKFSPEKMRIFRKMHLSNEVLNALWKTFIAIGEMAFELCCVVSCRVLCMKIVVKRWGVLHNMRS